MTSLSSTGAAPDLDLRNLSALLAAARDEARLSHLVVARDLPAAVYPALLFAVAARITVAGPLLDSGLALLACGAYFWLFLYSFCLDNQITGVDEDRLNKPDRAIPSGRLTLAGARGRQRIVAPLFFACGLALGVPLQAAAWLGLTALNHHAGWDRHWLTKNLGVVGLGAIAQLSAAWTIAAPGAPVPWTSILALSGTLGLAMCIQDFRDVPGDRLLRRRTLPIALGEVPARAVCVLLLLALPLVLHLVLVAPHGVTGLEAVFDGAVAAASLVIAARLWTLRTPDEDDRTYRLLPKLYCLEIAFTALFAA